MGDAGGAVDKVRLEALELATMAAIPGVVAALARLNVFQALAQAGENAALTAEELGAVAVPGRAINVGYLGRLLRMMAAKRILREVVTLGADGAATERRYALEPVARYLVADAERGSFLDLLLMFQAPAGCLQVWEHVDESVVDDSVAPFVRAHGMTAWEYGKRNAAFDVGFNKAMAGLTEVYMRAALDAYLGFQGVRVLVDVGGGFGASLRLIVGRYPHVRGVNFDQPHVIDTCPPIPGVELVGGDMFKSVPSGGDAIFMKYILHDWDDECCVKILKNCYKALPPRGKVIAMDHVLPEIINLEGGDHMAFQIDVHMMAFLTPGARERTERDFHKLGLAAGFKQVKLACKVDDLYGILEFHKAD